MKESSKRTISYEGEKTEFNADLYQLFNDLSSKTPKEIDGFRTLMHREIDAFDSNLKDEKKMHVFMDLLADVCIEQAELRY